MKEAKTIPLEEVCNVEYGNRVVQKRDGGKGFPVYGGGGATFEMDVSNREDRLVIARFGMSEECTRFVVGEFYLNDSGLTVSPKNGAMLQRFLDYQMLSLNDDIYALGKGTAQKNLDVPIFRTLPLFVPPLAEQQRIVGVLDEAFAGLATAQANAEKNLQNARALFESHLQSVFTQRGKGWVETTLGDEVEFSAGFAFKSTRYINEAKNGTRLLRGDNIMQGEFRWENAVYWPTEDTMIYERFRLEANDIVLAMDRPWVTAGLKIAYVASDDLPCIQVQRTARLRVSGRLSWRYLFHLLRSQEFVSYLLDGQTGLGVPHISGKQILAFQISRPSLADQIVIAENLDALLTETQRLASLYQQKLAALAALKKSLLHQAFSGEL